MHLRALAQRLHSWRTGIAIYLLHSLPPLLRSLGLEILLRQVFQFHYVAMLGLIVGQVGQQERLPVSASQKVLYIKTDSHIAIEESGISSVCLFFTIVPVFFTGR